MKRSEIGHKSQLASVSVSDGPINSTYRLFNHASAKSLFNLKMHMDRLRTLESQMENLNSLPTSRELLEKIFPSAADTGHVEAQTSQDQRRVSELWQTVQMKRRVDATEEGLSRLSSLTDDLLNQIKRLSDENKRLSYALEEAKKDSGLKDKLTELEKKLLELEKRRLQDASLLKNVVHMDALRGLVFWHSLGAAVTGIDYLTAYANATDKMDTNEKFLDENKSDNGLINKWPENKELIGTKANREELEGLGVPPELLDRLAQLESTVKELAKEREKNKKLIKTMQDTLAVLQKQIVQMHQLITATQAEMKGVREQFADLQQFAEDMDTRKVDATQMDAELLKVK
ncbi:Glutamine rich 2 [Fasciolopsis buskii]|uniref:Glutamine rich 2 n=1 Tax=Fasciolopsis buskii TaxID=27845 RepID=A0A8E0VGS7_9TREM|nr:Glutamine rich 2 [Fasciolopsis buski]